MMTRTKSTFLALLAVLLSPIAANADVIYSYAPGGAFSNVNGSDFSVGVDGIVSATAEFSDTSAGTRGANRITLVWSYNGGTVSFDTQTDVGGFFFDSGNNFTFDASGMIIGWAVDWAADKILGPSVEGFGLTSGGSDSISTSAGEYAFIENSFGRFAAAGRGGSWAAVPEPGTLALLGIGLIGMGMARRKKA